MKSWFFISVAIVLLGFSVVYLVVKETNNGLEFAPGVAPICVNTPITEEICAEKKEPSGYFSRPENVCVKKNSVGGVDYALPDSRGNCPVGYTLSVGIRFAEIRTCDVLKIFLPGKNPSACANSPPCVDGGPIGWTYAVVRNPDGLPCCKATNERKCTNPAGGEPNPSGPGGTGGTTPGPKDVPGGVGSGKRDS